MPLNLNTSFKRRVEFGKQSQKCRWVTHFTGCAREVAGALELLAKNREDRFIFAGVDAIVQLCNKEFQVKGQPPVQKYSKRHVEDCLKVFRELGILSHKTSSEVDGVLRKGRFFNPHDSMTTRYPLACVFVGGGKKPGTWANGIWQQGDAGQFGGLVVETTPDTTPGVDEVTGEITVRGVDEVTVRITDAITVRGVDESVDETPQKPLGSSSKERRSDVSSAPEPIQPIEPTQPSEPIQPPQPLEPKPRRAREWLSSMWNQSDSSRSYDDRLGSLRFRRAPSLRSPSPQASPAGGSVSFPGESPDVTLIEDLIAIHKEVFVKLAWAAFAYNFNHDKATVYPITVFALPENFEGLLGIAKRDLKEWVQRGRKGKPPDTISCAQYFDAQVEVTAHGDYEVRK